MDSIWLVKSVPVLGIGFWLLLAARNNFIDSGTNVTLLNRMMSMAALREDGVLGQGLLHRSSTNGDFIPIFLKLIASYQLLVAVALIFSGFALFSLSLQLPVLTPDEALSASTIALSFFMALWFFFLVGGLWFGYWIKMGKVQYVHFAMLIISVLLQILMLQGN